MMDWPQRKAKFDKAMQDWNLTAATLKEKGVKIPKQPDIGPWHPGSLFQPSNLYNGMVSPVVPYGIRGVIWYQGESNSDKPYQYRALLPALIRDWRGAWNEGDFPFLIVQLPNFMATKPEPAESNWALIREAQSMATTTVSNTAIATTIDIGQANNIHPKNKQEVGRRLGLLALEQVYKQAVKSSGPLFQRAQREGAGNSRLLFARRQPGCPGWACSEGVCHCWRRSAFRMGRRPRGTRQHRRFQRISEHAGRRTLCLGG